MTLTSLARCRRVVLTASIAFVYFATVCSGQDWAARDKWQRPGQVMDALGIRSGSAVADVGAGSGYFTIRLAERVGIHGQVYAVDIKKDEVEKLRERVTEEKLPQVRTVLGTPTDPHLPAESLDAILIVNAYHEMREYDAMMRAFYQALKPGGVLGIIDEKTAAGHPRERYFEWHVMPETIVRDDAARAGFRLRGAEPGFRTAERKTWYFLIFVKPSVQLVASASTVLDRARRLSVSSNRSSVGFSSCQPQPHARLPAQLTQGNPASVRGLPCGRGEARSGTDDALGKGGRVRPDKIKEKPK